MRRAPFIAVATTTTSVVIFVAVIVTRILGGRGRRRSRRSRDRKAFANRRVPSPAFRALRRRALGGRRVTRNTAPLLLAPVVTGRRAVGTLGRRGRGCWRPTYG